MGINLMCSVILLGFLHKGVSVKWDDLVTVCPTTSKKGLTQNMWRAPVILSKTPWFWTKIFSLQPLPLILSIGSLCFVLFWVPNVFFWEPSTLAGTTCEKEGIVCQLACEGLLCAQATAGLSGRRPGWRKAKKSRGQGNKQEIFLSRTSWQAVDAAVHPQQILCSGGILMGQQRGEEDPWAAGAGTVWHSREELWTTPPCSQLTTPCLFHWRKPFMAAFGWIPSSREGWAKS